MLRRTCLIAAPLMLYVSPMALAAQTPESTSVPTRATAEAVAGTTAAAPSTAPKPSVSAKPGTRLTWLGHAAWLLSSPQGTTVLVDPWLNNPKQPKGFTLPEHIDAIVVTHGHADHVGEAVALAEKYQAPVVASFELIEMLGLKDGIGVNPGGTVVFKDIELHLTQAIHSSSLAQSHPQPPAPPSAAAAAKHVGDETCDCPDHSQCVEHHHHDGAHHPDNHAAHADAGKANGRHHHKHKGAHKSAAGEAQELVVGGDEPAPKAMGPMERAVTLATAGKADASKADGAPLTGKAPCHCGPEAEAAAPSHEGKPHLHYAGAAMGVVFKIAQGPTIYHAGDTDVFLDMGLIKRRYEPEVALLPIGGHYTMGPKDAALAATLLGVQDVVPMHYGTSPQLAGTPAELKKELDDDQRVIAPLPGATISYIQRKP